MYERFSDRARKVMALANQEAHRFNHEYINTEHILLGLIKEGSGVGANVLKRLDVDLVKLREEVGKLIRSGEPSEVVGKLPLTPRAKNVITYAIEEARSLNANYVGTEHLLLGLLREQEGLAAQVLTNLGVKLEAVREETRSLLGASLEPDLTTPTFEVLIQHAIKSLVQARDRAVSERKEALAAELGDLNNRLRALLKDTGQASGDK